MSEISTRYWKIDDVDRDIAAINVAGRILRCGGLIAFPTETVYGLGANALDGRAARAVFRAKGRPQDNPLIVHIADFQEIHRVAASLPSAAKKIMQAFWPGPLTLVLPKKETVPDEVTGGLDTVAVRMPDHPVAKALIAAAGVPVAAPSANLSGSPSPTKARHVLDDLNGRIDGILDGGPADVGVESTVLDLTTDVPTILRPGGVTAEQLLTVLADVRYDPAVEAGGHDIAPRSPGVKYKHYSPKARVILLEGELEPVADRTKEMIAAHSAAGQKVGVLACAENASKYSGAEVINYGSRSRPAEAAAVLYDALRRFDHLKVDVIIAEGLPAKGMGTTVMDRLRRSAGGSTVHVK